MRPARFLPFAVLLLIASTAGAQQKPALTPADYGRFETLLFGSLSPDGTWLAAPVNRTNEENELRLHRVGSDSTIVVPYGSNAAFSKGGHWAAWTIGMSEADRKAAEKAKKPAHSRLGLLDITKGTTTTIADIANFELSGDGRFIAMRGYAAADQKHKGVDLIVRDLATGVNTTFGNVSEYAWQDDASLLAFTIDAETRAGNGVKLYDPTTGVLKTLESDTAVFRGLRWRSESDDLALLRVRNDSSYEGETHVVITWTGLAGKAPARFALDQTTMAGFPADTRIVSFRPLSWTHDGQFVLFGLKAWERKEKPDSTRKANGGDDEEKPGVEIWHAKDVDIIPEQKVRAQRDRERNFLTAWDPRANRLVEIGNELTEDASVAQRASMALALDQTPYERERMYGPVFNDLYVVDLKTAARKRVKERVEQIFGAGSSLSPTGRYLLYLQNDHFWVYDVTKDTHTNVTRNVPTSFINTDDDHTVDQKPPYGTGGWTPGDRSVLLYDKYDVWEITVDGSKAERLTNGAAESIRHRIVRLDFEDPFVDAARPFYVALYGEKSKKYGYGRAQRGRPVARDVWLDANVTRLTKAEDAEVYGYVVQTFEDSPDYFVGGPALAGAQQVTRTNPFQSEYAWSPKSELIEFTSAEGKPLQAALHYPANWEPGRKYPMIVYIYEITSNTIHSYSAPSERSAYNQTVWTQDGYFVLKPDIVYRDRNPGLSAVDAIVPAVEKVVGTGMVDGAKVGLVGHSWGGYQTAFVSTVTNTFAAGVAGAPLTELTSMYLSIYWNSGGTDARIFEISQGRMEVPPWKDLDSYTANSAVWNIEKMETPLLVTFGDKDGAVDWHQGIVMYNAARRENKDLVMLVYEGENHGLAKKPNQLDYHRRVTEWFAHYLKGEPAPDWITSGVRFLDKDKELNRTRRITTEPISGSSDPGRNQAARDRR
ncbi:MAG: prolyl oligopeptidase family serine peptidase [Gemmatimonadetes bacterium]|nr:prolyl oligopeptidase family serine peptidase [Gemmatimonadota bacterium]